MTTQAAISFEGVAKRYRRYQSRSSSLKERFTAGNKTVYDEFWALDDIDFRIGKGEMFGLIGHNGSGKSTLLKLVAGIIEPTKGTVLSAGRTSSLLELGAGFHPELSGRDNVYLNGTFFGYSRAQIAAKMPDIVEFAGVGEFIDQPVKTYSSGMYARLGFAVATSVDPEILLVDEVLAVGDEEFQRKCIDRIMEFQREGRTIIFVSHALGSVRQLCTRVAWLDHGHLRGVGPPDALIDRYLEDALIAAADNPVADRNVDETWIKPVQLASGGADVSSIRTGEPLELRIAWDAPIAVKDATIALSIERTDGITVYATNNMSAGEDFDIGVGPGSVSYTIDSFDALPGTFIVAVAIGQNRGRTWLTERRPAARFAVLAGVDSYSTGIYTPRGRWDV